MNLENPDKKGPEDQIVELPKSPQELQDMFAIKEVDRDPGVVATEQGRMDDIKRDILFRAERGAATKVSYGTTQEGDNSLDVDSTKLEAMRMVAAKDVTTAKNRAKWTAGIGGALGLGGGFLATGATLGVGAGLAVGAAVAAVPIIVASVGYGFYKWVKNREVVSEENKVKVKWGLDEYGSPKTV